jgi:hypothetical protein
MAETVRLSMSRYDFPLLIDAMHISRGVEIGVHHGWFSYYLLKHSGLKELWGVDSYAGKYERCMKDASSYLSEFGDRSRLIKATSMEGANLAERTGEKFGFIYIDGNHKLRPFAQDVDRWLPRLKRPGIFAGHDYIEGARLVSVIPIVQRLADRLNVPIYLTREEWASWFLILGDDEN